MKTIAYRCNCCGNLFDETKVTGLKNTGDMFSYTSIETCKPKESDKHYCEECYIERVPGVVNAIMKANEMKPGTHPSKDELTKDYEKAFRTFVFQTKFFVKPKK